MNVLITGGLGFLGSNISAHFLSQKSTVTIIDAMFRVGATENRTWLEEQATPNQLNIFKLDLADAIEIEQVFISKGPFDYICHLGGQVAMTTSLADPRRDLLTNVLGTFNILESMRKHSPDGFLAYSSTNKVYGDLKRFEFKENPTRFYSEKFPEGFDEALPLDFASPYGCSKGAADQYVRDWYRNYKIKTVVLRHSSIFGGRQHATYDQGWIGWFCQKAIEQKRADLAETERESFTISGSGKQVRDVLHAADLVNLYQKMYQNRDSIAGEVFNIGGGILNSLSLIELFNLLEQLLDLSKPLTFSRLPRRQSDQDYFVANTAKSKQLIGWQPQLNAKQGIETMLNWVSGGAL